jgi:hypothetical protein
VSDRDQLLALLGRVRTRLTVQSGVEGLVAGAAGALGGWAAGLACARWLAAGALSAPTAARLALLVVPLLGAVAAMAWRWRVSRLACARALDRAAAARGAGGEARNGDRAFVATALLARAATPFVEAAIADAVRSLARPDPTAASPWRRPRALPALAGLAMVVVALTLWPPRRPAAQPAVAAARAPARKVPAALLGAEADAAAQARARAEALSDPVLRRLAERFSDLLGALASQGLSERELSDRLAALAEEARAAAGEGEALREALGKAGSALGDSAAGKKLGEAMRSFDGAAARAALEELAGKMGEARAGERRKLAEALERAGAAAGGAPSAAAGGEDRSGAGRGQEDRQRRLSRPEAKDSRGAGERQARGAGEAERQLKRLERDLDDSADRCREDPEACKQSLQQTAEGAEEQGREAQRSSARQRLSEALEQARERLRRDGMGAGERSSVEGRFERSARGQQPTPGMGQAQEQAGGAEARASGGERSLAGEAPQAAGEEAGAGGDTPGKGAGGDPLGGRSPRTEGGSEVEQSVASGPGPARAEVIETGARQGFGRKAYGRVYQDYESAVEETLDATAVPAGRRYLVRRYFQLIRPR